MRARRPAQTIVILLSRRATRRRVEGGAGSKRFVLGCDPGTRHWAHQIHAIHTHLRGHIPASGAPVPRYGAPPILAATLRAGTSFGPWCRRSPCPYRHMGCLELLTLSQNRASARARPSFKFCSIKLRQLPLKALVLDRAGGSQSRGFGAPSVALRGRIEARSAWNLLRPPRDAALLALAIE